MSVHAESAAQWDRVTRVDDPVGFEQLSQSLRLWEPGLTLHRPATDALFYVDEGAFHGVFLAEAEVYRSDRRVITVRPGDAVVVPRDFPVDAGEKADLVGFIDPGPPPDHFRERFIQVQGFEHFPTDGGDEGSEVAEVIPFSDARLRIPYAFLRVNDNADAGFVFVPLDPILVVVLEGTIQLCRVGGEPVVATERTLATVAPGVTTSISGKGRAGLFCVLNAERHAARRRGVPMGSPRLSHEPERPVSAFPEGLTEFGLLPPHPKGRGASPETQA